MALQKISGLSLVDQVVAQMESLIQSGEWPVGTRIPPEPELVKQLGVSRNTVREAVKALNYTRMLKTKQGDGTYVNSSSDLEAALLRCMNRSTVGEMLEVRYCLEREIARLASCRRTPEDVHILQQYLNKLDELNLEKSNLPFIEIDIDIHYAIVSATHNRVLIDLYNHMAKTLRNSISYLSGDSTLTRMQLLNHRELIEAILHQNTDAAEKAALAHIQMTQQALQKEGLGI